MRRVWKYNFDAEHGGKMNKFEKKYTKVMKEKEEIMADMVKFLFSAINFIVETGKLAEFMDWQVKEAEKKL